MSLAHPIQWLYQQFGGEVIAGDASCYLCGANCSQEQTVARGIAETFNSHYLARSPSSSYLCAACAWYFSSSAGHPDFRKMSLVVERDSWHNWERPAMKGDILHTLQCGVDTDVFLIVSLSKKKHILLQAPLNVANACTLSIQVEEQVAHISLGMWEHMDAAFMRLVQLGHNKGEILSGNLYGNTLKKHGQLAEALLLSKQLEPYRHSAALELLSYVTIVEKGETDGTSESGNGTDRDGSQPAQSSMEPDRRGIQVEIQNGNLVAVREQRRGVRTHEQQPAQISEPSLWEI